MGRLPIVLLLLTLSSCRSTDPPKPAPEPATLDVAAVKARSHAFLDANDHENPDVVGPMLGKSFVRFVQGHTSDRKLLLDRLRASAEQHAPAVKRTWGEEHVTLGEGTATFLGDAVERFPSTKPGEPERSLEFSNTLVWVREGADWKVAYWHVERVPSSRESWNEAFRSGAMFQQEPNQLLVDTVKGRAPGAALDIAMGQGRNAIYLASQGWKVTGIDISDEGIRIAKETAARRKLQLEAIEADMDAWDLGTSRWDLVTMIYAGADPKLVERIKASLRPGGLVVIEVFHDEATGGTRSSGFASGQPAKLFQGGFSIVRDEVVQGHADWGPPNDVKLVRFVARKN